MNISNKHGYHNRMETRQLNIFHSQFITLVSVFLCVIIPAVLCRVPTKYEFLQSRPEKGLIYYLFATGNSNYDKGGNSLDVMRVMTDDIALDFDERYPLSVQGEAEHVNIFSVGGDLLGTESLNSLDAANVKRLGMRACCAGYFQQA